MAELSTVKPVLTTKEAVEFLAGPIVEGQRRPISRRSLMKDARSGRCPVWQWTTRGPLFSSAQLTAWLREQSATPPTQRGAA